MHLHVRPSPLDTYTHVIKYRDHHTIRKLLAEKNKDEWHQSINDWVYKLQIAKQDIQLHSSDKGVKTDQTGMTLQLIDIHIFAMGLLTKMLDTSEAEIPVNPVLRHHLLGHMWREAYSKHPTHAPLGDCLLTVIEDVDDAQQDPQFCQKLWEEGKHAPGHTAKHSTHGWQAIVNDFLAGSN